MHTLPPRCAPKARATSSLNFFKTKGGRVYTGCTLSLPNISCVTIVCAYTLFWSVPILVHTGHSGAFRRETQKALAFLCGFRLLGGRAGAKAGLCCPPFIAYFSCKGGKGWSFQGSRYLRSFKQQEIFS